MMSDQFDWRHVLYRLYDAEGELLYIGITQDLATRFRTHARLQQWWPSVSDCRTEFFGSRRALEVAERQAIRTERPTYNMVENTTPSRRAIRPERKVSAPVGNPDAAITYTVTVTREDGVWAAVVGGLPPNTFCGTDEPHLADLFVSVPDLVACLMESTDFNLTWHFVHGEHEYASTLTRALAAEDLANDRTTRLDVARRKAIAAMRGVGLSYRDIADALQMSHQRVSQLVNS